MSAGCTRLVSRLPSVLVTIWRLHHFTFLPASNPRGRGKRLIHEVEHDAVAQFVEIGLHGGEGREALGQMRPRAADGDNLLDRVAGRAHGPRLGSHAASQPSQGAKPVADEEAVKGPTRPDRKATGRHHAKAHRTGKRPHPRSPEMVPKARLTKRAQLSGVRTPATRQAPWPGFLHGSRCCRHRGRRPSLRAVRCR